MLPGNDEENAADPEAGQQHVHPDVWRQRVQEREHTWICPVRFVVENGDSQSHKRLGEVNDFLSHVSDGERSHGQICHLETNPVRYLM